MKCDHSKIMNLTGEKIYLQCKHLQNCYHLSMATGVKLFQPWDQDESIVVQSGYQTKCIQHFENYPVKKTIIQKT